MKSSAARALVAVVGAIALLLGLGACGGNASADLVGVWELQSLQPTDAGSGPDQQAIDAVQQLGMSLDLKADNTVVANLLGESESGTWKVDGSTVSVDMDGDTLVFTVADGTLTGESDGLSIVLAKK